MLRTKELMQLLEQFNKGSETGGYARVQVVSKSQPNARPKDIREVQLVENKIIGSTETHRLIILTE